MCKIWIQGGANPDFQNVQISRGHYFSCLYSPCAQLLNSAAKEGLLVVYSNRFENEKEVRHIETCLANERDLWSFKKKIAITSTAF